MSDVININGTKYTEEDLVDDYTVCPSGCYIAY